MNEKVTNVKYYGLNKNSTLYKMYEQAVGHMLCTSCVYHISAMQLLNLKGNKMIISYKT